MHGTHGLREDDNWVKTMCYWDFEGWLTQEIPPYHYPHYQIPQSEDDSDQENMARDCGRYEWCALKNWMLWIVIHGEEW